MGFITDLIRSLFRSPANPGVKLTANASPKPLQPAAIDSSRKIGAVDDLALRIRSRRAALLQAEEANPSEIPASSITPPAPLSGDTTTTEYELPPIDLLDLTPQLASVATDKEAETLSSKDEAQESARVLENVFSVVSIGAEVVSAGRGPTVTLFLVRTGSPISEAKFRKIETAATAALGGRPVRAIRPAEADGTISLEVPNRVRDRVGMRALVEAFDATDKMLPLVLGWSSGGNAIYSDLSTMPHVLIEGDSGTEKSTWVHTVILSLLLFRGPEVVRLILMESSGSTLSAYADIPHLVSPVVTTGSEAYLLIAWATATMDDRLCKMRSQGMTDNKTCNVDGGRVPYVVIIIDGYDAFVQACPLMRSHVIRLITEGAPVGMQVVLTSDGSIRSPGDGLKCARILLRSAKCDGQTRYLLDVGDALYTMFNQAPMRIQGAILGEGEIAAIAEHVKSQGEPMYERVKGLCSVQIMAQVFQHRSTLQRKRAMGTTKDDYGNVEDDDWKAECSYFCDKVLAKVAPGIEVDPSPLRAAAISLIEVATDNALASIGFTDGMSGSEFEALCCKRLIDAGWKARCVGGTGDQGCDVIAEWKTFTLVMQCKRYDQPVGNGAVQEVYAACGAYSASGAAVITNASYTKAARMLAKKLGVVLLHHDDLSMLTVTDGVMTASTGARREMVPTEILCDEVALVENLARIDGILALGSGIHVGSKWLTDRQFHEAVQSMYRYNRSGVDFFRRKLDIGYNKAMYYVEQLEDLGFLGAQKGTANRDIIKTWNDWIELLKSCGATCDPEDELYHDPVAPTERGQAPDASPRR